MAEGVTDPLEGLAEATVDLLRAGPAAGALGQALADFRIAHEAWLRAQYALYLLWAEAALLVSRGPADAGLARAESAARFEDLTAASLEASRRLCEAFGQLTDARVGLEARRRAASDN